MIALTLIKEIFGMASNEPEIETASRPVGKIRTILEETKIQGAKVQNERKIISLREPRELMTILLHTSQSFPRPARSR